MKTREGIPTQDPGQWKIGRILQADYEELKIGRSTPPESPPRHIPTYIYNRYYYSLNHHENKKVNAARRRV